MKRSYFGSETRAQDGCIVTFELPDGEIYVERFSQVIHTRQRGVWDRARTYDGDPYTKQAAARADELEAKILCISTPETILTDMQGTRAAIEPRKATPEKGISDSVWYPEVFMLGKIGRVDLFKRPTGGHTEGNIRQVTQRRPTHSGLADN